MCPTYALYVLDSSIYKPALWWYADKIQEYSLNPEHSNNSSESGYSSWKRDMNHVPMGLYGGSSVCFKLVRNQVEVYDSYFVVENVLFFSKCWVGLG